MEYGVYDTYSVGYYTLGIAMRLSDIEKKGSDKKDILGKKTVSISTLAKKHDIPVSQVLKLVYAGIQVEKEHTSNEEEAMEIAMDHINEMKDYYKKLKSIEH